MKIATATPIASTADSELIAAATALIPVLRARSNETAGLAKLPDATIADLEATRIFDMTVPHMYGGLQTSLRTLMEVIIQLARGDGSVAWTVDLLSGGTWAAAALFPKSVTDVVFASGKNARVAGSMNFSDATTRRVDGGIIIEDGIWRFNSGVEHAGWDILGIAVASETGDAVDRLNALLPISDVTPLHDWNTSGLRGSGSTSVTVKNVFVPNERLVNLGNCLREKYGAVHLQHEPLYQMPFVAMLAIKVVFPALGMAKAALALFVEKAPHRGIAFTPYDKQNEAVVTHLLVAEASMKIDTAELLLQRAADELDSIVSTGGTLAFAERVRIRRDTGYANRLIWEAMDELAGASGGSSASVENGMNRIWQDVRVASLHGGVTCSTVMELFGRVMCGLPPNTPLI
jgi:3-hydroxy-9,10-secoandrosta-1,3,5(10)-triene-9,17-dione monooxygenase